MVLKQQSQSNVEKKMASAPDRRGRLNDSWFKAEREGI
jgi:hypothetical protein